MGRFSNREDLGKSSIVRWFIRIALLRKAEVKIRSGNLEVTGLSNENWVTQISPSEDEISADVKIRSGNLEVTGLSNENWVTQISPSEDEISADVNQWNQSQQYRSNRTYMH
ncbi:hypothetical protein QE152_g28484 [Popillia japonica]|uniref:Uncharacterized protein n=1 Tax=Popillia japonica TaxID=7064 RepID=A0AAW1JIM9_POPJA